jgi:parallel beta-helix repeat protein
MEAADSNMVVGNYIGTDATGLETFRFSNDTLMQGNGLYFNSNAAHNTADGNIISGNRVYGLIYYGNAPYNACINNYIGVDITGNTALANTTGICVDGGANHNPIVNNVLSGNLAYGIFIVTTTTYYNELKGNKIGTNAAGTAAVPNQIGVILGGGTKYNTIGGTSTADRNIISGNIIDGIEVADSSTMYNNIIGNYIGTDITGNNAIPNYNGIGFATRPSKNNIENNVISGNDYAGLLLFERSDSNTVYSNFIGTTATGSAPLSNGAAGIVIFGSLDNIIGEPGRGNIIAYNDTVGIVVADTASKRNSFSANQVFQNVQMDIEIFPYGVNTNDAGDVDAGANEQMNYPEIGSVDYDWSNGTLTATGTIDHANPNGIRIELFLSGNSNNFGHGGANEYLGYTTADASGNWSFIQAGVASGWVLTATATDANGNTSELSLNVDITTTLPTVDHTPGFCIFPNPASEFITISGIEDGNTSLTLVYPDGREIAMSTNNLSNQTVSYNLKSMSIAPGIYFLRTEQNHLVQVKKVIVLE